MSFSTQLHLGPNENGIFVGDITTGTLFYFEPNADRTGINLESDPLLSDLIADSDDETSTVTFGTGFAGITDIETSPDGNLYILAYDRETEGQGSLYRILPTGEDYLLEFLPLRLRTPLLPQLLMKVRRKPKRVQKMRRTGTMKIIMREMIRKEIATKMNNCE